MSSEQSAPPPDTSWDVDKYRSPHEPSHHWALRKRFMEENKDRFPEKRLVCLAQVFANAEFMGCRYPKETMDLVEDLSYGIVQPYREEQKSRLQRTFVSGSDAAGAKVNRGKPKTRPAFKRKSSDPSPGEDGPGPAKLKVGVFQRLGALGGAGGGPSFVRASEQSMGANTGRDPPALTPADPLRPAPGFEQPQHQQQQQQKEEQLQHQFRPRAPVTAPSRLLTLATDLSDPLSHFILVVLEWQEDEHPCNVLSRSAGFCRMACNWEFRPHPAGTRCLVKIAEYQVSSAVEPSKNEARDAATRKAVETLSRRCYTVKVKNKYLGDGSVVDSADLGEEGGGAGKKKALGSENVGHRLLKLMGWSGGGLGKGGGGISEPVTATAICNREGLGANSADREFKQRVKSLIEEYAASSNPYDLVFTSGFTNEQRKEMHMIAKRLGLRSKSFGKGEERFLTISRKTDGRELIRELIARGGANEKYELVPPSTA